MADTKVSEMTAATSVNSADVVYLVQNSTDKKLSMSTLLGNLPNTPMKVGGLITLSGTPQSLANSGIITTTQTVTVITNSGTPSVLTINNGTYDGQIKVIISQAMGSTSTISSNLSCTSIVFNASGKSVQLMWYNNVWCPLGGTATITF